MKTTSIHCDHCGDNLGTVSKMQFHGLFGVSQAIESKGIQIPLGKPMEAHDFCDEICLRDFLNARMSGIPAKKLSVPEG